MHIYIITHWYFSFTFQLFGIWETQLNKLPATVALCSAKMPMAHGVGHWPKSHFVQPPPQQPSGPAYIQSYDPNWKPRNQAPKPRQSDRPASPNRSPQSRSNSPGPRERQYNDWTQQRNSPPPRYSSERPEPPRPFRAKNYYGEVNSLAQ
jgi:hypothetical protein